MPALSTSRITVALIGFGLIALAACKPPRDAPPSVEDLMGDRVALDGILMKCNDPSSRDKAGVDCEVARVAVERLARQKEAADEAARQRAFERNREQLRQSDEQRAARQAEKTIVDPYTMPVVPVDPSPASAPTPDRR
jgi:hypothetical protein